MTPLRTALLALALASLAARSAHAFTDEVHRDIAEQAARLAPASLRSILATHASSLAEGASAPLSTEPADLVLLPNGGSLDQLVARQATRVSDALAQRAPMSLVAREFGALSRAVALASDPLHVTPGGEKTAEWAPAFERFTESRRDRFRLAFGGYASADLDRDDVPAFVRTSAERARRTGRILDEMFVGSNGAIADATRFDDRHPVFGIAALGWSHAVTDTARIWLYVWIKAGGEASGLPFPQALPGGPARTSP